eukprot:Skav215666  [mRNA]  locus=scaffold310:41909:48366:+ [translate_table: standard]
MQCLKTMLGLFVASLLSGAVALKAKEAKAVDKFGFYFPVHSQIPSTLNVLKSVRQYYPNSPIYLLQDGGNVDFGKLCKAGLQSWRYPIPSHQPEIPKKYRYPLTA